jgi:ATP-dependent RNA helicase DeaD
MEVALAAVKLAHEATGGPIDQEQEIPDVEPIPERESRERRPAGGRGGGRARTAGVGMTRLFVGLGRRGGVRPQDLVGAIANESSLRGRQIGAIEIADSFSLVEVPESAAEEVITALRGSTVKGRKVTVRRERR